MQSAALLRLGILVTLLCAVKYTDASLVVTLSTNRSVYLTDGESLELVCEINQDVGPSGVWFMKDDHIRIWLRNPSMCEFDKTINSDLSMYNMICKHPRRYILVIHRINVSDHKTTWKCSIASKEGGKCFGVNNPCISKVLTFFRRDVAKITDLSVATSDILNENDTAILRCFVDSNPESSITWRKEGHGGHLKTDLYSLQRHLVFNCVQCLDASNYTCEASNGLGSHVERRISLHVNCHPRTDFRSPSVTKVYSKLGGEAALTYTVISYPDPKFEWIFTGNGSEIKALPYSATQKDEYQTSTLIFTNLDVNDFGYYSVIATNPFPPAATCVFELIIAVSEGHENEMRLSLVGMVAVIVVLPVVAIVVFRVKRSRYRNGTASQQGKQSSQSDDDSAEIRPVITNSVRVIEVTGEHECLQLKANESPYLEVYDVEPDYSSNINSRLPGGENYESLHIYSNNLDQTYCCVKPPQRQALV